MITVTRTSTGLWRTDGGQWPPRPLRIKSFPVDLEHPPRRFGGSFEDGDLSGKTFAWKPAKRTVFRNSQWGDVSNIAPKELRGMKRQTPQKAQTVIFTWKIICTPIYLIKVMPFIAAMWEVGTGVGPPTSKRSIFFHYIQHLVFIELLIILYVVKSCLISLKSSDMFSTTSGNVKFEPKNYEKQSLLEWNVLFYST